MIPPGGPYFKMPWEKIHKVSIATMTVNMALDLENPAANDNGTRLEAVTKDQLNTGLTGQIRYRVSEANLYAFLFGIKKPFVHVMAYFVSVLRQRIANFEAKAVPLAPGVELAGAQAPLAGSEMTGISINDLRKNLRDLNEYMDQECRSAPARYGVILDASLITGIDPPPEVESALAAINTAHNQVSSDISLAQAAADQSVVQSRRAVEIETLSAQAEVEPVKSLAAELGATAPRRAGRARRLPAQRAAGALRQGAADLPGGREMTDQPIVAHSRGGLDHLRRGISSPSRSCSRSAASSASTPSSRSAPAASTCCSAKWSACSTNPGCTSCPPSSGPAAFVINLLGNCYVLDLRLDQEYLRSQPVNSEEGAPMGIGIWYEMWISDPVSYLFKNTDPRGSLRANVSNATVRCLSNMKLAEMLETRHNMSQTVRAEVTGKSQAWGYQLGSRLHPQGAFPRRRHDPPDRREGGEPPAPGDLGDQAGRRRTR